MKPPIFIVGCPRSGTTVFSGLCKFTEYGEPFESHFITKYYKKLYKYGDLNQYSNFSKLVRDILKHWAMAMWNLDVDINEMFTEIKTKNYINIVNYVCGKIAKKTSATAVSWGDKTPDYTLNLDELLKIFPDSKIIYLIRDGRDVAMSLLKQHWGQKNIYKCAVYWKKCVASKTRLKELKRKGKVLEVKYEELLKKPELIMSQVYKFLEQEYDSKKMKALIDTIKADNYNKWKKFLSNREIRIFEGVAGTELAQEGYELKYAVSPKINRFSIIYYNIHDLIGRALSLLKRNTIGYIQIKLSLKKPYEI